MADTEITEATCDHCGQPVRPFMTDRLRWDHLTGAWVHTTGLFSCSGNLLGNEVATVNGSKRAR